MGILELIISSSWLSLRCDLRRSKWRKDGYKLLAVSERDIVNK